MAATVVLLTVAALYFGRDIFLPFALAVLLSFLLAPLVAWLRRKGLPRVPSVVLVVSLACALIGGVSALVINQALDIAGNLPAYQSGMLKKIRSIHGPLEGKGLIDKTTQVIKALGDELSSAAKAPDKENAASGQANTPPVPVQVVPPTQDALTTAQHAIAPLLGPISTAGLVIIFVFFVLLEPSDLRDRFIRLAGGDLHRTTEALGEAARRVSRYLLMQLVVNVTYAIPLGIGLYLIGVPVAFLWALLAALLRFIPYLGPVIGAVFPLTMAFVVDPGWSMLLWSASLILTIELISNNVIEPWLYGSSTGLTPVAVILAAIFWTLLWGPVGLILATPLTVCLVVMARYVPVLSFLDVLLGSDPVLQPEERLYQRLLAGNVEEAFEIAEGYVAEQSLIAFYNEVGVSALRLAENDRQQGVPTSEHRKVADGMTAIIQDLREQVERREGDCGAPGDQPEFGSPAGAPLLCVAGRSVLDVPAAAMLLHALEETGIGARQAPPSAVAPDAIGKLDLAGVDVVCILYLAPVPKAYARFACRRLKRRKPQLKIILGLLNLSDNAGTAEKLATYAGADAAAATIEATLHEIEAMVKQTAVPAMQPPPLPEQEKSRLEALQASGLLAAGKSPQLDRVARKVAEAFDMPIGLVTLIDDSCQLWKGAFGLPENLERTRQGSRETSICTHVVAAGAPLMIEDTAHDPRFASNPFLLEHQMRFYAGVPLRPASGHTIGSLCVIDHKPRMLNTREMKLLQVVADELMADIGKQPEAAARPRAEDSGVAPTDNNSGGAVASEPGKRLGLEPSST